MVYEEDIRKDYFAVTPCEILNWVVMSSEKKWRLQLVYVVPTALFPWNGMMSIPNNLGYANIPSQWEGRDLAIQFISS